jgi:6-phosphogluconolactonase (cycloisomerase 2 family)
MKIGKCARVWLPAAVLVGFLTVGLTGCGDFWQAPSGGTTGSTSLSLANSGNISMGQSSSGTSVITVTPGSSFAGTVALTCAVTAPTATVSATTCSLSPTSVSITGTTSVTSTLTATTTSAPLGAYDITVTGVSGSVAATTTVCVEVTTTSGSCSVAASNSGNFYILNSTTISGYSIVSGTLTPLIGSPYALPSGVGVPAAMAVDAIDPATPLLYVSTTGGIYLYPIESDGALPATPTTISQAGAVAAIQVDPSGRWLLAAYSLGSLSAIPITSTGIVDTTRSVQTPMQLAGPPIQMAISPSQTNAIVAVALGSPGTQAFPFAAGDNTAPIGNPYRTIGTWGGTNSGSSAQSVAIDPQNRFLYIGEIAAFPNSTASTGTGGLRVLSIDAGSLSGLTTTPTPSGGTGPHAILAESSGNYVYVANWAGNATGAGFQVGSAGALTQLSSTFTTGNEPMGLAEDSKDSFVMVVSGLGDPDFEAYSFSSSTGLLSSGIPSNNTGADPIAIVAVPK